LKVKGKTMNKHCLWLLPALFPILLSGATASDRAAAKQPEPHRGPIDVAILPGGKLALTANQTADSVSLVDLVAGKVLAERPCGRKPGAVACSRDGNRVAVSNLWSGTLTLLERTETDLRPIGEFPVGYQPRGLVFSPDGTELYVALAGAGEVVRFDWRTRKVPQRWPAPIEPRSVALTRDGRFLAAGSARSATVHCWDTSSGKQLWEQGFAESFNLHGLTFSADDQHVITCQIKDRQHSITKSNIENGWALDSRLGQVAVHPNDGSESSQIALDLRGRAVGDPCCVACSKSGEWLGVTAAGTHELLLIRSAAISWSGGEAQDFIDDSLAVSETKYRRVPLGGRPVAIRFLDCGTRAVVANYLLDSLQVVEIATGKIRRTISLGGPERPSLVRQGEAVFYDALRSHHQWFSCNTCHPDGHTSGRNFDTLNDDSLGNPKLTPSLRGVTRTGPWTWHGWQKDLGGAVEKSLIDTLYGKKPPADDVKAVLAFLATLDHPPNPNRRDGRLISTSAEQGKAVFEGKAHCIRCHHGDDYTSTRTFDLKLEPDGSPYEEWNPPSLRGVIDRGPYLHDGRAATLDELLRLYHGPEKLGGARLSVDERRDLIEFLNSL
jgi:DNA-binding beta-propeller fold protein YncE